MIWILLPAYNEQHDLPRLLEKMKKALGDVAYRLVVVNDGSTDKTSEVLEKYGKSLKLDIVSHPINRGLGETERDGFEFIAWKAQADDFIVRIEGDDTHEPKYLFDLIEKLKEGYDVVNTSRFQPGGGQMGVDTYRAFISRSANVFMKLLFRHPRRERLLLRLPRLPRQGDQRCPGDLRQQLHPTARDGLYLHT